jgi:hypothetical protein
MSESTKAGLRDPSISIGKLEAFVTSALASVGIPGDDARQGAALMAESYAYGGMPMAFSACSSR